ncbi:MAG TPA: MarR family transcriptional regulator [Nocardioides sp.]|nr:MarR family transcriptional regulator [Nocardioides sp.]
MGSEVVPSASHTLLPALAKLPGHLLWRANARVQVLLDQELPDGVDIHAYAALLALADGTPRSQQSLADSIAVSRTTMVRVAAELAEQGLVERVRNPTDRRSYALTRTRAAAAAVRRWRPHIARLEASVVRPFTPAERDELRELLLATIREDLVTGAPAPLLDSVGFLLTRTHFRMHREFGAALAPLRIEPRHFGVLTALQATGPVPQSEVARALGVSGASVVQMVDDLEHLGLVERRRLPTDRRTQVLHVLPDGQRALVQAREIAAPLVGSRLDPLNKKQTDRLVVLLVRLVTAE